MAAMSRFTIKNLRDVEDSAGELAPGVEGRFARKYLDSEHLGNGLELIAVRSDRPEGGGGVMAPSAWIDELEA